MQRLLPPNLVALLLIAMALMTMLAPWPALHWLARLLGAIPFIFGMNVGLRHAKLFKTEGTPVKTFDVPRTFVTSGAFAWTRNPMYLGFVLILLGVALGLGSSAALAGPVIFFVAADRWYIPFEERRMAATFGADYESYQRRVPRWVRRMETT